MKKVVRKTKSAAENDEVLNVVDSNSESDGAVKVAKVKRAARAGRNKSAKKTTEASAPLFDLDGEEDETKDAPKKRKTTTKKSVKKTAEKAAPRKKTVKKSTYDSEGTSGVVEKKKTVRARKRAVETAKPTKNDVLSKEASKDASKDASEEAPNERFDFVDLEPIRARIRETPTSDEEKARRARYESLKERPSVCEAETICRRKLPVWEPGWLVVSGARQNNLKMIDVPFPLSAFSVVTGVSGSGKSSLVEDVLYRYVVRSLNRTQGTCGACEAVYGVDKISKAIQVDQSPIGQSPASNAATYTGLFDLIRQFYAQLPESKLRGYSPRRFSFNIPGGRCEKCEGAGMLKVEMLFLADVWAPCDVCKGKRYDAETLQVKYRGKSIADVLETTCGAALDFFAGSPQITRILRTLCDVGLDYLPLGQSATTLSGGEAQRVKLASELSTIGSGRTLYVLDEPTTGLHFEDVRKLLDVLHRLVDLGNTVVVVEHNLDVIKNADWIVEVGPDAGLEGGRLVFAGTPEQMLEYAANWQNSPEARRTSLRSHTGEALIPVFRKGTFYERPILDARQFWKERQEVVVAPTEPSDEEQKNEERQVSPWEIDGRRWHTEFRTCRNGKPCRWEGLVLSSIVDKLEESGQFAEIDWNSRNVVEARGLVGNCWFMRAVTNEEWLLKLRFRTARNTFSRDLLTRKLDLKPLNEIDEIPLYGTQARVKLETVGIWQEIEAKVYSFAEIDRPEFWEFLDLARERFVENVNYVKEESAKEDLTPWKTLGRDWHFSQVGFYGEGEAPAPTWNFELLEKLTLLIEEVAPRASSVWTNKVSVPFSLPGVDGDWARLFTKDVDFLALQVNFPKDEATLELLQSFGMKAEFDATDKNFDSFYFKFQTDEDFQQDKLRRVLKRSLASYERR